MRSIHSWFILAYYLFGCIWRSSADSALEIGIDE